VRVAYTEVCAGPSLSRQPSKCSGHRFTLIHQANNPVCQKKRFTVPDHSPKMLRFPSLTSSQPVFPTVSWLASSSLPYCFDGSCSWSWVHLLGVDRYGYARPIKALDCRASAKSPPAKRGTFSFPLFWVRRGKIFIQRTVDPGTSKILFSQLTEKSSGDTLLVVGGTELLELGCLNLSI